MAKLAHHKSERKEDSLQGLEEIAIAAVQCRRTLNHNFSEFVAELERKCSAQEVRDLLEWAESVVTPTAPVPAELQSFGFAA